MEIKRLKDYTEEEFDKLPRYEKERLMTAYTIKKIILIVICCIIGLILFINLICSFKSVPSGFVGVKSKFGQVQNKILNEGLNFKVPFIEKITLIDCRTQKTEYTMEASSKDLQKISNFKVAVNYNVNKESANKLYKDIGIEYKSILIEPSIQEAMKATIANYTAEELITKRNEVSAFALEALYNKLNSKGITVTGLNILDLSFSTEFDEAIERKQVVEQQTKTAELELEKQKIENEKQIENAKANAEVMKQQNNEITDKTLELKKLEIQEKFIEKWNGQLPSTMLNDNINGLFNIK